MFFGFALQMLNKEKASSKIATNVICRPLSRVLSPPTFALCGNIVGDMQLALEIAPAAPVEGSQ
jgi:hypothetical protein